MAEFDLSSVGTTKSDDGVAMPLIHPGSRQPMKNEDGSIVSITLLGQWSEPFQETLRSIQISRAKLADRGEAVPQEVFFDEDTRTLIACTMSWTIKRLDNADFPCTPANIKALWLDKRFRWLRQRALQFIVRDANFLAAGSETWNDTPDISSVSLVHSQTEAAA